MMAAKIQLSRHDRINTISTTRRHLQQRRCIAKATSTNEENERNMYVTRTTGALIARSEENEAEEVHSDSRTPDSQQAKVGHGSIGTITGSQAYVSLLPPFFSRQTVFERFQPGIYTLTQPLQPPGQSDIRLRMVVYDMGDCLVLIGPLAPTEELKTQIAALGKEVRHIIVQNSSPEHWFYAPALSKCYPNALVHCVPGFLQGRGVPLPGRSLLFRDIQERGVYREMTPDSADFPFEHIKTFLFDVPFFNEAALYLKDHHVLMVADTAVCLGASDPAYTTASEQLARAIGVWDRLGPITRPVFEKNPVEGRTWVEAILKDCREAEATGASVVILPAHGSSPVYSGTEQFADCFSFLF